MPTSRPTTRKSAFGGFTLLELLVVIAIITLLAAILFPVFHRVRENARKSSCQSNLKQLAMATAQYTADYDEMNLPFRSGNSTSFHFSWRDCVEPYLKNAQVLICPSSKGGPFSGVTLSYTYNAWMGTDPVANRPRRISAVRWPSQTPMFADAMGVASTGVSLVFIIPISSPANGQTGRLPNDTTGTPFDSELALIASPRHLEGANYAFADGHVKWYPGLDRPSSYYFPSITTSRWRYVDATPPKKDLDYDVDGVVGDNAAAGTAGLFD